MTGTQSNTKMTKTESTREIRNEKRIQWYQYGLCKNDVLYFAANYKKIWKNKSMEGRRLDWDKYVQGISGYMQARDSIRAS